MKKTKRLSTLIILSVALAGGAVYASRVLSAYRTAEATPDPLALCTRLPRSTAGAIKVPTAGPIVSIDFDDGFLSAYRYGIPLFNAAGFPVTAYIITGDLQHSGNIDLTEIKALEAAGNEIGAHTITHPHLTNVSEARAIDEICGSREALLRLGILTTTFAYPDGYSDPAVESIVKDAGFIGARDTEAGLNDAAIDPYELKSYQVTAATTLPEIEYAIAQAVQTKGWLILTFHRVDDTGNSISVPHQLIRGLIAYLKKDRIPVVTNAEGLAMKSRIAGTRDYLLSPVKATTEGTSARSRSG